MRLRLLLITLILPALLSAFGFREHEAVAKIAWKEMTPEAKNAVLEILAFSGDTSMVGVATWADLVRPKDDYRYTSTYHYINIPADGIEYDKERDCIKTGCITEVIPMYIETLTNPATSDSLKNEALKFIIHFVGDIHQPMHCGLPEDRGGNDVKLRFKGKDVNLHGLWDYGINEVMVKDFDKYIEKLHKSGTSMDMVEILSVTDPVDWTNESYKIARSVAYTVKDGDNVSWLYARKAKKAIDTRITVGGYRLAHLLNSLFLQ